MMNTYSLFARPLLIAEGEFKGKLKGVMFVATSSTRLKQWFTVNCGQLEAFFGELVPDDLAKEIIASLTRGDDVTFPDRYQGEQIDHGFFYEGSPVHFELLPSVGPVEYDLRVELSHGLSALPPQGVAPAIERKQALPALRIGDGPGIGGEGGLIPSAG